VVLVGAADRLVAGLQLIDDVIPSNVIRAFASVFLNEPHRTTRSYKLLREQVGKEIFGDGHKLEPYYAAAYGLYRLDWLFRNDTARFASKYKPARFHVLLATRLIINPADWPRMNSRAMVDRATDLITALWSPDSDKYFLEAIAVVDRVAGSNMQRDHIRQKPITDDLLTHFGLKPRVE
jgi:hypothetical protein